MAAIGIQTSLSGVHYTLLEDVKAILTLRARYAVGRLHGTNTPGWCLRDAGKCPQFGFLCVCNILSYQYIRLVSHVETTFHHNRPQKVPAFGGYSTPRHSCSGLLPPIPSPIESSCGPTVVDERRSVGEFSSGFWVLGRCSVRGCHNPLGRTNLGGSGVDIGVVL